MPLLQGPLQIFIFHEVFPNYYRPCGILLMCMIVCLTDSLINNYLLNRFRVRGK